MTDLDLLRQYARAGCQQAFSELVRRHIDMVYAACLRRLRNRHDAEDATQAVFIALAGKAQQLSEKTVLGGWLYRASGYIGKDMLRKAKRREDHEMAAAIEKAGSGPVEEPDRPDIDQALAKLTSGDREAIVLRFLEDRSFREVGDELRISEEAARKRVSRALRRLRGKLTAADGAALTVISVHRLLHACLQPAPPALLAATTKAALANCATGSPGAVLGKGAATIMATTNMKLLAGAALLALLSAGAFVAYKFAAPPVPRIMAIATPSKQIADVSDQNWNQRFMEAYRLAPGQVVKLVKPVPVADRLQYWNSLPNNTGFPLSPQSTLIFKSNGSDLHWTTFTPGWIPLAWAIGFGPGLAGWQLDGSIPQGMRFDGDWVFRQDATRAQMMDALAQSVSQRLGRQVRFVQRSVMRDALIARGNYKFVPLAGYANDGVIQLTDRLTKPDARFIFPAKLADLLDRVSLAKSMHVIDQTGSANLRMKICDQMNWRNADAFVANIAAQTSLHFDREPRQMDIWFMIDANEAQPRKN